MKSRAHPAVVAIAGAIGLLFLFPLVYLVWSVARLGGDLGATLASAATLEPLRNSLILAVATTATSGILGVAAAGIVVRGDVPLRRLWRIALALPLVIPSFVGATAVLAAFGPGGLLPWVPRLDGFWGAWFVLTLLTYPYVYLPVAARLGTTAPGLEEASRLLGAGTRRTLRRVVWPQVRSSTVAGALLVFLYVLSDFGAVALMRYDTITRAIFSARLFDRATSVTLGLILAVLALAVAAAAQAPAAAGSEGSRERQVRYALGWWRLPGQLLLVALVGLGLVAPIAVFVAWLVRGSTTIGVGFSGLGDDVSFLVTPTINSAVAAVVTAAAATVVVLPVAYGAVRSRRLAAKLSAAAVASVFALPGLVVALAVVFWAIAAPEPLALLYQSFALLIAAYVLHFAAQSLRAAQTAIADVPIAYDEAARTLGAGAMRRFFTIEMPLIRPGLIAGAGLVLLSTLKELPATLLLAPIGFKTLATTIWSAAEDGFFAEVGLASLVLIALSAVLTWLFVVRREPV